MEGFYTSVTRHKNKILVRGIDSNDRNFVKEVPFKPFIFKKSSVETGWSDIFGNPVKRMDFSSICECNQYIKDNESLSNASIIGTTKYETQYISENYRGDIKYNVSRIRGAIVDIEVDAPEFPDPEEVKWPITAVSLYDTISDCLFAFGHHPEQEFIAPKEYMGVKIVYKQCTDEADTLISFLNLWSELKPDYFSGWNTEIFDTPYLIKRCYQFFPEKKVNSKLSVFGIVSERKKYDNFGKQTTSYKIVGCDELDYMTLYRNHPYIPTRDSYSLDNVSEAELNEKKLSYEEHGSLPELYTSDFSKYMLYNIRDVLLVKRIDEKLKLFDLCFMKAYYTKSSYSDTLGTIACADSMISTHLLENNVAPPMSKHNVKEQYGGGFVMEPVIGRHKHISTFDLNSLYPHNIMQWNIGPETIIDDTDLSDDERALCYAIRSNPDVLLDESVDTSVIRKDACVSGAGYLYRTDKIGVVSFWMNKLYADRKVVKKEMLKLKQTVEDTGDKSLLVTVDQLELKQLAIKLILNAFYGAIANNYFRYYDIRNAKSITYSGQLAIKWAGKHIDLVLNRMFKTGDFRYVIYSDTDSCFIRFDEVIERFMPDVDDQERITNFIDTVCREKIQPEIDDFYIRLQKYLHCKENKMVMEREKIGNVIFVRGKGYAGFVYDNEGVRYAKPKLNVTGLEAIKSNYPLFCRDVLKECYEIALLGDNDQLIDRVDSFRKEFMNISAEVLATTSSCNNIEKYADKRTVYKKGAPRQVKAALHHNRMINDMNLQTTYPLIVSGDKIKYIPLKMPNPVGDDVIGFKGYLPKEFDVDRYCDRNMLFEKNFMAPLETFISVIDWTAEKTVNLFDFA